MRWPPVIVAMLICAALLVWVALAGADVPTGAPASYATAAAPAAIVDGFDGNLWFVEPGSGDREGTITPAGVLNETVTGGFRPSGLASGVVNTPSSGVVWVATGNSDLSFLTPFSALGQPPQGRSSVRLWGTMPGAVAADAHGDLWVIVALGSYDGAVDEVAPGAQNSYSAGLPVTLGGPTAQSIATGSDGTTMWVTEPPSPLASSNQIASITPATTAAGAQAAVVKQYPLPAGITGTLGQIVLGPDGNMYAGLTGAAGSPSYVVQITPTGGITPFALPSTSTANPGVLALGPDHLLWMAGGGMLTSMSSTGVFANYPGALAIASDVVSGIAPDPSADALWLTDATAHSLLRVQLQPPVLVTSTTQTTTPPAPPPLTVAVAPPSNVSKTAVTLTGTITEPAGSDATPADYQFEYGTSPTYGTTTPSATTTATSTGATVTAQLGGLAGYTTYHYRLVANDCTPPTSCAPAQSVDQTFTTGSNVTPVQNEKVGVTPVTGTIRVELPNANQFKTLPAGKPIPVGATVSTRNGTALIQSAVGPGVQASGQFSKGIFKVTQPKGGTETVLTLVSNYALCQASTPVKARIATVERAKRSTKPSKKPKKPKKPTKKRIFTAKIVNQVFGNAHGQFKTRGHYATAADEGTSWRTTDRCDGTQVTVTQGTVSVTDFVHHRTIVVTAGHHYLAKAHH